MTPTENDRLRIGLLLAILVFLFFVTVRVWIPGPATTTYYEYRTEYRENDQPPIFLQNITFQNITNQNVATTLIIAINGTEFQDLELVCEYFFDHDEDGLEDRTEDLDDDNDGIPDTSDRVPRDLVTGFVCRWVVPP